MHFQQVITDHFVSFQQQVTTATSTATATATATSTTSMDMSKVCPTDYATDDADADADADALTNNKINIQNTQLPPSELMDMEEIRSMVKVWYDSNCQRVGPTTKSTTIRGTTRSTRSSTCLYSSIGQHLLQHAFKQNKTLLTVQVGVMDGISNDPMYEMFVTEETKLINNNNKSEEGNILRHWLPVLIEPVPINYKALLDTYSDIAKNNGLGCAVPIHAAVSYNQKFDIDNLSIL